MPNQLRRWLFNSVTRTFVIFLFVVFAWLAWWVASQRPVKTCSVIFSTGQGISTWTNSAWGHERMIVSPSGVGAQIIELDLATGQVNEIVKTEKILGQVTAHDLSWAAYGLPKGEVQVVRLPGAKSRFTIPFGDITSGLWLVASHDNKRLAVIAQSGSTCEVWDVADGKQLLSVNGALGYPAFSHNGKLFAIATSEPAGVGVWEFDTQRKIASIPAFGDRLASIGFHPDGRLVVGYSKPGTDDPADQIPPSSERAGLLYMPKHSAYPIHARLFSVDYKSVEQEFDVEARFPPIQGPTLPRFSKSGNTLHFLTSQKGVLWDISGPSPKCLDELLGLGKLTGARVSFDDLGQRMLVGDTFKMSLLDEKSLAEIPIQRVESGVHGFWEQFTPDGRFVTISESYQATPLPWWKQFLRKWFRRFLPPEPQNQVAIFDAQSGKLVNRLPGDGIVAWPADGKHVWIHQGLAHFELHPIRPPMPPWWLWLLTTLGAAVMIWDIRRAFGNRRKFHAPSPASIPV